MKSPPVRGFFYPNPPHHERMGEEKAAHCRIEVSHTHHRHRPKCSKQQKEHEQKPHLHLPSPRTSAKVRRTQKAPRKQPKVDGCQPFPNEHGTKKCRLSHRKEKCAAKKRCDEHRAADLPEIPR